MMHTQYITYECGHLFLKNVEGCRVFILAHEDDTDEITKQVVATERRVCAVTSMPRPCGNAPRAPQTRSGSLLTHREGESLEGDKAAS